MSRPDDGGAVTYLSAQDGTVLALFGPQETERGLETTDLYAEREVRQGEVLTGQEGRYRASQAVPADLSSPAVLATETGQAQQVTAYGFVKLA